MEVNVVLGIIILNAVMLNVMFSIVKLGLI
jgi:hypothetical protein